MTINPFMLTREEAQAKADLVDDLRFAKERLIEAVRRYNDEMDMQRMWVEVALEEYNHLVKRAHTMANDVFRFARDEFRSINRDGDEQHFVASWEDAVDELGDEIEIDFHKVLHVDIFSDHAGALENAKESL